MFLETVKWLRYFRLIEQAGRLVLLKHTVLYKSTMPASTLSP